MAFLLSFLCELWFSLFLCLYFSGWVTTTAAARRQNCSTLWCCEQGMKFVVVGVNGSNHHIRRFKRVHRSFSHINIFWLLPRFFLRKRERRERSIELEVEHAKKKNASGDSDFQGTYMNCIIHYTPQPRQERKKFSEFPLLGLLQFQLIRRIHELLCVY